MNSQTVAKRRGFTLTEIAIVLGIIGTILGAIWVAASKVYNNQRVETAVSQIVNIAGAVRSLYPSGQMTGGNQMLNALLMNGGYVGGDQIDSSCTGRWGTWGKGSVGCMYNPWHDQIVVGTQTTWDGFPAATNRFEIVTDEVARNIPCAAFLGALVPQAVTAGLVNIYDGANMYGVSSATATSTFAGCTSTSEIGLQFQL